MATRTTPLRLAFVGWGAISRASARLLSESPVEIVAVAVSDLTLPRPDLPTGARLISQPDELDGIDVDLVAEAASREAVQQWTPVALGRGVDVVISSVSALADPALVTRLRDLAIRNRCQLQISPGALAGVDALAAAQLMGIDEVEHRIVKPPRAWIETPAEEVCDLGSLGQAEAFFVGTAEEAATHYPKNANSTMTTALAGIGSAATMVTLVADPAATANRHEITATGPFGHLEIAATNSPLEENPKTSAMAALSLARAIQNSVSPIAI